MDINEIAKDVYEFELRRDEWVPGASSVAERCALIAEEVSEVYKDYRNGAAKDQIWHDGPLRKPQGIPVELADVILRAMATMRGFGVVDVEAVLNEKMAWNWANR